MTTRISLLLLSLVIVTEPAFSQAPTSPCELLVELKQELNSLRRLYTEKHPEVMQVQERFDGLARQLLAQVSGATIRDICPQLAQLDEGGNTDEVQDPDRARQQPFP